MSPVLELSDMDMNIIVVNVFENIDDKMETFINKKKS